MTDKVEGMKHRDFKPCLHCGKGVMHAGHIMFYRVTMERFVVDAREVQRAAGMEMMMGGNALLANIMGPNADLAKRFSGPHIGLVCHDCSFRVDDPLAVVADKLEPDAPADADEAVTTPAA